MRIRNTILAVLGLIALSACRFDPAANPLDVGREAPINEPSAFEVGLGVSKFLSLSSPVPGIVERHFSLPEWTISARFISDPDEDLYARIFDAGSHQSSGGGVSIELNSGLGNAYLSCILWNENAQISYRVDALMPAAEVETDIQCEYRGFRLALLLNGGLVNAINAQYMIPVDSGIGIGRTSNADLHKTFKGQILSLEVE